MEFGEIRLENVGPIRRAAIGRHRVSVFVGPNNSGKSVAARIVHGACRLDMPAGVEVRILADGRSCSEEGAGGAAAAVAADAARSEALLRCAGIGKSGAASRSEDSARISLGGGKAGVEADAGRGSGDKHGTAPPSAASAVARSGKKAVGSVYIPAGRAGAVWSVLAAEQLEGGRSGAAHSLGESGDMSASACPPGETGSGVLPGRPVPEHLGPFCEVVREAFSGGLGADAEAMFSRLFGGSIEACAAGALPAARYRDPSGEAVDIGSAGSGVVSALPVVAVHRVEPGGTLVVEEPEADTEAMGQLRLAGELVRAALRRNVRLVVTTHSDFVVHAMLGMVHNGDIDPGDLGLYYFRRERGSRTDVERVYVNRAGEAELELFNKAIDALADGSVLPDAP